MSGSLSVIIPVYNAEKYLRECLDSVLGQSLAEIEVICVDDCSTDSSPEILEEYSRKDKRVICLKNDQNMHAGPCRNRGLEAAHGEYVLFMDGDDILLPNSLAKLLAEAERLNADVLRCRAVDLDNETGIISCGTQNYLKRVPFFLYGKPVKFSRWYWLFPKFNVAPWGGIFRREFLIRQGIRFNSLLCVNDRSFYWESMLKAERIAFSRTVLLKYRMNLSSSLVGGRIRNFPCHFASYALVEQLVSTEADRVRRTILNGEMMDITYWAEKSRGTDYEETVRKDIKAFLDRMDLRPWNGAPQNTDWYKRLNIL